MSASLDSPVIFLGIANTLSDIWFELNNEDPNLTLISEHIRLLNLNVPRGRDHSQILHSLIVNLARGFLSLSSESTRNNALVALQLSKNQYSILLQEISSHNIQLPADLINLPDCLHTAMQNEENSVANLITITRHSLLAAINLYVTTVN